MPLTLRIAFRNLREHKVKTFIIGFLIALGMLLLVIGNSLIDTANAGIKKSFIENFTGDIMVRAVHENPVSITGRMMDFGDGDPLPIVPEYQAIYDYLSAHPDVEALSPQVVGVLTIELHDGGQAVTAPFGIDPVKYAEAFPENIEIVSGRMLEAGESGIVLSEEVWKDIVKEDGSKLQPGEEIKMSGISGFGFRVKRVPIVGIFRFNTQNTSLGVISLIDVDTLRYLNNMVAGTSATIIDESEAALLSASSGATGTEDLDALFGEDLFDESATLSEAPEAGYFDDILGDTSQRAALSVPSQGSWHYVLVRLKDSNRQAAVIADLNAFFAEKGWSANAVNWQDAAGGLGIITESARAVFLILVALLTIVSAIVIMNTLVVSIIERTSEIGMMRALGAQKRFVRGVFFAETMTISLVFGIIGMLVGMVIIAILGQTGIEAPNEVFEVIFGGSVLNPVFSVGSGIQALVLMALVGWISSVYPIAVALRIQPVKAMQA